MSAQNVHRSSECEGCDADVSQGQRYCHACDADIADMAALIDAAAAEERALVETGEISIEEHLRKNYGV